MAEHQDNAMPSEMELIHLYFGKPTHELDARTLAVCLMETSTTIEQIGLTKKDYFRLGMRVKPFQPGSFEVPVEIYPLIAGTLFAANECLPLIRQSVEVFVEYLKLKKLLKGKEPVEVKEEGEKAIVKAADGSTVNVNIQTLNVFQNNGPANASMERQFQQLEHDESVQSFEIKDNQRKQLFESQRKDFPEMKKRIPSMQEDSFTEKKTVNLCINKPVLDQKPSCWRFIHEGSPISAKMKDQEFLDRVAQGEQFAMGDRLEVEMEVKQEFDPALQTHKIKGREIVKVLDHIPRPVQREIGFGFEG